MARLPSDKGRRLMECTTRKTVIGDQQSGVSAAALSCPGYLALAAVAIMAGGCNGEAASSQPDDATPIAAEWTGPDRTKLPILAPPPPMFDELDARDVERPEPFSVVAPAGAPNIVIVLIDDVGIGAPSAFGGPIETPVLEELAASGLSFNRFHTTALCSPTRAALKSGRNHHAVNMGSITETATSFPGNTGQIPDTAASIAQILRLNGYNTAAFGKWHETAAWETSLSGPYDRWPTNQGFEKFYGFIGGETDQWHPAIFDGTTKDSRANVRRLPLY